MQTKKLLGSTLALSMVFSAGSANAELLKNLKLGGQIDLQSTAGRNVTDFTTRAANNGVGGTFNDRIGDAQTRVMLNADWDILDDVSAKVTLRKNDRSYGTAGGTAQGPASNSQTLGTAGGNILGSTFVDQAYFKVAKLFGELDLTAGRQFYGNSGDMVIYYGPSDKAAYGLWVTAIDAVRADWSNDSVGITAMAGKTTGHAVGVAATADVDVQGLNVMVKGNDMWNGAAYVWNQVTHNVGALGTGPTLGSAGGKNDFLYVAGLKAKVMAGPAWIAGEIARNFGDNRVAGTGNLTNNAAATYTGWAGKVDLGAKLDLGGQSVTPWAHYGYGSGDGSKDGNNHNFTAISPDYRPGSIYGRFAVPVAAGAALGSGVAGTQTVASNTLSNRSIWGVGVKAAPVSKLTAGVSYWDYSFATRPGPGAGAGLRHIGSEADVDLTWAHSENVTLGAGAGYFWAGGYLKDTIQSSGSGTERGDNPAIMGYFDVRVKF